MTAIKSLGFANDGKWKQVLYFAHGGTGSGKGESSPLPIESADLIELPVGAVVEKCSLVVTTAVTGTTALDVGDDDDADGFIPAASVTLGTPGLYGWSSENAGAYLKTGAGNAPNAKLYSATGKEVKLAATGTSTAGAFYLVVEGSYHGRA